MNTSQGYWVATTEALDEACAALSNCEAVGLDTEFMRETTFHAIPALIQLSDGERVWLIDPCAVEASDALRALLGPQGPLKLIHACSEDLEVLAAWAGCLPEPLIDTQVAEGFCGGDTAISYQRLVERRLGIEIPKDATRSDWLARPLSEQQRRYAMLDVLYLPQLWRAQRAALEHLERLEWVESDCQAMIDTAKAGKALDAYHLRNRNAWRLSPRSLAAYAALCAWREEAVRARDVPRGWLANDGLLFAVAERMPKNRFELAEVPEIKPALIKRESDTLLGLVKAAQAIDASQLPRALPSPVSNDYRRRLKVLKRVVEKQAERLGLAAELLARRRDLDAWVQADLRGRLDDCSLEGWRGALLDDALRDALKVGRGPAEDEEPRLEGGTRG
ncbi:ribonuclease D [Halotalea alkalilenta]|uniref:ribonuclease D n=1 Tax=Halotalea alkalilenta TaxID=376489 RepID=UPI000694E755|nr:ribonuclease D [Halotalea alkalilenta]